MLTSRRVYWPPQHLPWALATVWTSIKLIFFLVPWVCYLKFCGVSIRRGWVFAVLSLYLASVILLSSLLSFFIFHFLFHSGLLMGWAQEEVSVCLPGLMYFNSNMVIIIVSSLHHLAQSFSFHAYVSVWLHVLQFRQIMIIVIVSSFHPHPVPFSLCTCFLCIFLLSELRTHIGVESERGHLHLFYSFKQVQLTITHSLFLVS